MATLEQQLEAAHAAAAEAQQAKDEVAASAERDADTATALQQQLVAAQGRMEAVAKERDMLQDKIGQLRTENKRLNEALSDAAALQERLAAAEAAVEAGEAAQARVAQLQGANERLQREHASVNGMVARLEEKLRQVCLVCAIVASSSRTRRKRRSSTPMGSWTPRAWRLPRLPTQPPRSCRRWTWQTGTRGRPRCWPWWRRARQRRPRRQRGTCRQMQWRRRQRPQKRSSRCERSMGRRCPLHRKHIRLGAGMTHEGALTKIDGRPQAKLAGAHAAA